ncbi:MAG TPA: lmo0937 family membrane protein [Burkholderiales bacterium]|nr:lmo0937 family membrane protein [Burkholderiales bacterium]
MLYSIAIILILLWIIGMMSTATLGGFIHVLPALAAVLILFRAIGPAAR